VTSGEDDACDGFKKSKRFMVRFALSSKSGDCLKFQRWDGRWHERGSNKAVRAADCRAAATRFDDG
jgi:hypothetical protein